MNKIPMHDIVFYIEKNFPQFGVNKKRELTRLLYEISIKEACDFKTILPDPCQESIPFKEIKANLLRRRFPDLLPDEIRHPHSFKQLSLKEDQRVLHTKTFQINPEYFYVEKDVWHSELVQRLKSKFPQTPFEKISSIKTFSTKNKKFSIVDYNDRLKSFFIIQEQNNFCQACPCSETSVRCGYQILNLGYGCGFECVYCFLQAYTNSPGIILPANIKDFFKKIDLKKTTRVGSGQFTDSLIFDPITEFSPIIVNSMRDYPDVEFEFKTKSSFIHLLGSVESAENVIVSWTLNPQKIIETIELNTSSLEKRLLSAQQCVKWGYKVAFHFDPIICIDDWEKEYKAVIDRIFALLHPKDIRWISMGGLRMTAKLKQIIENRFPEHKIIEQQLVYGYDGKLRYPYRFRKKIYAILNEYIQQYDASIIRYLCMEEKQMWQDCSLSLKF